MTSTWGGMTWNATPWDGAASPDATPTLGPDPRRSTATRVGPDPNRSTARRADG